MVTKRYFSMFVFVVVLLAGIGFTIREITAARPVPLTGADRLAVQESVRMQRVREADTARWNGIAADYYAGLKKEAERAQRARKAETARWNAIAADYFAREAAREKRVREAETARWNGIAADYFARQTQEAPAR